MIFIFRALWVYRVFVDDARNAYSSSLYRVRHYQCISYSWCFGRPCAQLDCIVYVRVLKYVVVVSVRSSTLLFHMLYSLVVSVRSSTISMRILLLMCWSSVDAARLLCLCASFQISCSRLCMELDFIVSHATFNWSSLYRARQYQRIAPSSCFGRLWMQLDFLCLCASSQISCGRLLVEHSAARIMNRKSFWS